MQKNDRVGISPDRPKSKSEYKEAIDGAGNPYFGQGVENRDEYQAAKWQQLAGVPEEDLPGCLDPGQP